MKNLLIIISILCANTLIAQYIEIEDFNSVIIDPNGNGNIGIACYDVDNDGDKDIISIGGETELNWYRNDLDLSTGSFSFQKINIDDDISGQYLDVADINNDNIPEILCSVPELGEIILYHGNSIADSIFWDKETIVDDFMGAHQVHLVDMDGDSDYDILAAANIESKIKWWENNSGDWLSHIIENNYDGVQSVVSYDFNNDGYQDVVSGIMSQTIGLVNIWYSSYTDSLRFIKDTLETQLYGSHWFEIEDVNDDGLNDIIVAGYFSNKIVAWERSHPDSLNFIMKTLVPNIEYPLHIAVADMDSDGDMDLLVPELSTYNHKLLCYENNDGNYTRNVIKSNFNAAWQIIPFDVDNDDDMDFVAGGFYFPNPSYSAKLTIFVNTLYTVDIQENSYRDFFNNSIKVYPNPADDRMLIELDLPWEASSVIIFNSVGKLVMRKSIPEKYDYDNISLDVSNFPNGIYFLRIVNDTKMISQKLIVNHR